MFEIQVKTQTPTKTPTKTLKRYDIHMNGVLMKDLGW